MFRQEEGFVTITTNYDNIWTNSMHQLAEVLPVTERTIQRYFLKQHFNRAVSDDLRIYNKFILQIAIKYTVYAQIPKLKLRDN